ncbi:hypothetical protein LZ575_07235 [Antarcticibacterium sp. 1MA-6-2]|nr:hypothetical protein LZ575_07235 [Antarcticibacterium sp. 1MA-6-2]
MMTVYPSATDTNMMETAEVEGMDSPEEVANLTIYGLLSEEINVIVGGEEREKQIEMNFNEPRTMDKIAIDNYENLEKRTKNHRSM